MSGGGDALKGPSLELAILQRKPESDAVTETGNMVDVEPLVRAVSQTFEQSITKIHQGPIPDPETFAAYDQVLPGCADRILSMAERSLDNQIQLEQSAQLHQQKIDHRQLRLAERSQWCALTAVGIVVAAGAWLVTQEQPVLGGIAMGVPLVGLAGAFLYPHLRRQSNTPQQDASGEPSPQTPQQKPRRRGIRGK